MFDRLADAAIYRGMLYKAGRYMRRQLNTRTMLRRLGMVPYTPVRNTINAVSLVAIGTAVGAGLALLFTPRTGPQMRVQVKERAKGLFNRMNPAMDESSVGTSARA